MNTKENIQVEVAVIDLVNVFNDKTLTEVVDKLVSLEGYHFRKEKLFFKVIPSDNDFGRVSICFNREETDAEFDYRMRKIGNVSNEN